MSPELKELINLAGSGTAPILAAWAVYRIGRLESRVDALVAALGAPPAQRRGILKSLLALLPLWFTRP